MRALCVCTAICTFFDQVERDQFLKEGDFGIGSVRFSEDFLDRGIMQHALLLPQRRMASPRCDRTSNFRVHFAGDQRQKKRLLSACIDQLSDTCAGHGLQMSVKRLEEDAHLRGQLIWPC